MKYIYFLVLLFMLVFFSFSCNSNEVAFADSANQIHLNADKFCTEWKKQVDSLSEKYKKSFHKEKIVYGSQGYILSEDLVKDCKLRIEIGGFVWNALSGNYTKADREFAYKNSKEIVDVLRKIWHSGNYANDGAGPDEKYSLLSYRGLNEKYLVPFIGELLEKDGFYPECEICLEPHLHYILLLKPRLSLDSIVLKRLEIAEKHIDIREQVTALVILNKNSAKGEYLLKLRKIADNGKISQNEKIAILKIIRKFELNKKIEFADLDKYLTSYFDSLPTVN